MWEYYSFVAEYNVTLETFYFDLIIVNIESNYEKSKISFFRMKSNTGKVGTVCKNNSCRIKHIFCSGTAIFPFKALVKPSHTSTAAKPAGMISRQSLKQNAKYFKNSTSGICVFNAILLILRGCWNL